MVTWSTVQSIMDASDIESTGVTDLAAADFRRTMGTTTVVNNGAVDIEFKSLNSGQNVTLSNGVNVVAASEWVNWGNNGGILSVIGTFETVLDWNLGIEEGNPTSAAITLSGLTDGTQYQIQFFADSTGSNSQTISGSDSMNSLTGRFVTGTFTADATSQVLTVAYPDNNFAVANALTIGVLLVTIQNVYWDLNGSDPNAYAGGGDTAPGTWNASNLYWDDLQTLISGMNAGGTTIPEPASLALMAMGAAVIVRRIRRSKAA